jgi:predicted MFS family arabinose efflux permease
LAGFLAIAVAFGPARNGYGLFLPDMRDEMGISTQLAGIIASASQAGYLISLSLVGLLAARLGPRTPVVIGGLSASLGMGLVAVAPNAAVLAAGFVLAATYAGWAWAPYNDAADLMVAPRHRARVLSVVSTGTTFGVLASGLAALAASGTWRASWFLFAGAALVATALNAWLLPGKPREPTGEGRVPRPGFGWFVRRESVPLFAVALSFGAVSAFYWAFAVDLIARNAESAGAGPVFYVVVGAAGFVGVFTGDALARFGLRRPLVAILATTAAAALLLGIAPGSWPVLGVSAVLYGACVMSMSALLAVWSSTVFAAQPTTGFSATLIFFGIGSVVGPAALSAVAGGFGLDTAFLVSAALALLSAFVPPAEEPRPRATQSP